MIKDYQWSTNWCDRWSWLRLFRIFGTHAQVTTRRIAIRCLSVTIMIISHFVLLQTVGRCKGVYLHLLQMLYLYCSPCILNGVQYCHDSYIVLHPIHCRLLSHVNTGLRILHKILQSARHTFNNIP